MRNHPYSLHLQSRTVPVFPVLILVAFAVSGTCVSGAWASQELPLGPDLHSYLLWSAPAGYQPASVFLDEGELVVEADPGEALLLIGQPVWSAPEVAYLEAVPTVWARADVSVTGGAANVATVLLVEGRDGPTGGLAYHERRLESESAVLLAGQPSSLEGGYRLAYQVVHAGEGGRSVVRLSGLEMIFGPLSGATALSAGFDGTFNTAPSDALFNINDAQGTIVHDEAKGVVLIGVDPGEAGNVLLTPNSIPSVIDVSARIARSESETDVPPLTMVVLTNGAETLAVFHAQESGGPEWIGVNGNVLGHAEEGWMLVAQAYNPEKAPTQAEITLDDLVIGSADGALLPFEAQPSADPTPTVVPSSNTEAVLTLPHDTNVGSLLSIGLTTLDGARLEPAPRRVRIELEGGEAGTYPLFDGYSDQDGRVDARVNVPDVQSGVYAVRVEVEGLREALEAPLNVRQGAVLFVETDKPIYQPGQTINGRLVSLNNELKPLPQAVEITVSDGKGIRVFRKTVETNADGVGAFELPLADELNIGTWRIDAGAGDSLARLDLQVDRYVLPRFEVGLETEKNWFLVDEPIVGAVNADYFFGKPVDGTYRLEALRYVGEWGTYATAAGDVEQGVAQIELPPVNYVTGTYGDEAEPTLQINLTVIDDAGHEESTSLLYSVVDSPMQLKMIPESRVVKPGLPLQVIAISEDPDGRPFDAQLSLEIVFRGDDLSEIGRLERPVTTTDGLAIFNVDVPVKTAIANLYLKGSQGGYETDATEILNAAASPSASFIHVRQVSGSAVKVGESVVFDVLRTGSGTVYYDVVASGRTVRSGVVWDSRLVLPITPELAPSFRVLAYAIDPSGEISADALPVDVEGLPDTGLTAAFDRDEARPGDDVQVNIDAGRRSTVGVAIVDSSVFALAKGRLNLQQVFTELERIFMEPKIEIHDDQNLFPEPIGTVGAREVWDDLGIQVTTSPRLNLSQGKELDPWNFWFQDEIRRGLPEELFWRAALEFNDAEAPAAGGGQGGAKSDEEPTRVRQLFPETWLWRPLIATDAQGLASLQLEAPDSITTWKLHAVGNSEDGIGITSDELTVFQPFFVEPDLPYAVIRGDEFPLRVQVYNYSDTVRDVEVSVDLPEAVEMIDGESSAMVQVPAGAVRGVEFTIQPTEVGLHTIQVSGSAGELADIVRKPLRVEPEGVRRDLVLNGILDEGDEVDVPLDIFDETPLAIPETDIEGLGIVPDSTHRYLSITPSVVGSLFENLDDLVGMPYGCGEQNMIFLAPDVEVLRYLRATGQNMPELQAKAELYVTVGYQRQLTYRHSDGSFSAFGESDSEGSLWLSAFVLSTFSGAREVFDIDSGVLQECTAWIAALQGRDGGWDPFGTLIHQEMDGGLEGRYGLSAYVTLALATYGEADSTVMALAQQYLEQQSAQAAQSPYSLALGATALDALGSPVADEVLDRLMALAVRDENGLHWNEQAVETTAYATMALLGRMRPESADTIRWLVSQRGALGGYGNTQDTVVAFKALTAAALQQSRNLDAEIDLLVDGEVIHTFIAGAQNFDVLQTLELSDDVTRVTLRHRGTGSVTYQGRVRYNVLVPERPPAESPLLLSVDYRSDHVAVDDIVDIAVEVNYRGLAEKTGMTIIDVSIPTGFQAVPESLTGLLKVNEGMVSRIEQPGRKVVFYLDELVSGEPLRFKFQVKALFPVRASVGVSEAYDYYDPDVRAESDGGDITVTDQEPE